MNNTENEVSLLDKGKKGILSLIFSRLGVIIMFLLLQLQILTSIYIHLKNYIPWLYSANLLLAAVIAMFIINTGDMDPTAKITWITVISIVPVFGALFFLYTQRDVVFRTMKYVAANIMKNTDNKIIQNRQTLDKLKSESPETALLASYLDKSGCFPVYENTSVTYFPIGEDKFARMLTELEKAEKFIFLEYFIIDEGHMWGRILDILSRKAKQGVEVCVMYDGGNEFSTLPKGYNKKLEKLGIKCKVFSPVKPFVSTHYNYRDHRKILVIDNKVAFNGGINLADEYINRYEKYGHWKDTAVMLKGEGVKSFTLMFLQMWNITGKVLDYDTYVNAPCEKQENDGFVILYGDSPLDSFKTGRQVYIDIINRAKSYVYIMTPYLILDSDMENALKFAAEKGVDVKIMLPGVPDKKAAYAIAKTHYSSLLSSGVKIYEYTPGFVHAKVMVSDDINAVVGTINLDYRSLYHHFECAAFIYKSHCIKDIVSDFNSTLQKCAAVTPETVKNRSFMWKLSGFVLKVFAPLM